ncbi:MAG: hypothetical protein JNL70_20040 [Saprospiraceae bacterium]|nr:hypothetical protein [Saprospiraceae bacterium]
MQCPVGTNSSKTIHKATTNARHCPKDSFGAEFRLFTECLYTEGSLIAWICKTQE